ncbi:MAG: hypothetical protein U5K84_04130 [Alkalibacterium sp.]|nr:hypothetical protein [Alkalibacterium sp.]
MIGSASAGSLQPLFSIAYVKGIEENARENGYSVLILGNVEEGEGGAGESYMTLFSRRNVAGVYQLSKELLNHQHPMPIVSA